MLVSYKGERPRRVNGLKVINEENDGGKERKINVEMRETQI